MSTLSKLVATALFAVFMIGCSAVQQPLGMHGPLKTGGSTNLIFNSQGTSGNPIAISGATTVLQAVSSRISWAICPEAAVRCAAGTSTGGAPTNAPSTTSGFLIPANTCFGDNYPGVYPGWIIASITQRIDCAPVAGTVNVDTSEDE